MLRKMLNGTGRNFSDLFDGTQLLFFFQKPAGSADNDVERRNGVFDDLNPTFVQHFEHKPLFQLDFSFAFAKKLHHLTAISENVFRVVRRRRGGLRSGIRLFGFAGFAVQNNSLLVN